MVVSPTKSPTKAAGSPSKLVQSLRRTTAGARGARTPFSDAAGAGGRKGGPEGYGAGRGAEEAATAKKQEQESVRCPANFIYRHCFSCSFDVVSICCNDVREQVLCSDNHKLYLWSTRTKELIHSVALPPDSTTDSLFYNRPQDVYYSIRNSRTIVLFYASGSKLLQVMDSYDAHLRPILCSCHCLKQKLFVTTGVESVIKVWKTNLKVHKQGGKIQSKKIVIIKEDELNVPETHNIKAEWIRDMLYDPIHARIFAIQEVNIQCWNVETGFLMYVRCPLAPNLLFFFTLSLSLALWHAALDTRKNAIDGAK